MDTKYGALILAMVAIELAMPITIPAQDGAMSKGFTR